MVQDFANMRIIDLHNCVIGALRRADELGCQMVCFPDLCVNSVDSNSWILIEAIEAYLIEAKKAGTRIYINTIKIGVS